METLEQTRSKTDAVTKRIIGCAFTVSNELGVGFLEKVYENALAYELKRLGLLVEQQASIGVKYKDQVIGEYICDLLVNGTVIVELKAVKDLDSIHWAQCMNYLRATGLKVCLLMNFGGKKLEFRRVVNQF